MNKESYDIKVENKVYYAPIIIFLF